MVLAHILEYDKNKTEKYYIANVLIILLLYYVLQMVICLILQFALGHTIIPIYTIIYVYRVNIRISCCKNARLIKNLLLTLLNMLYYL